MSQDSWNPEKPLAPEQLAAFVDGELGPEERSAVRSWVEGHPEAAAEAATWRRLAGLMQASTAPEPGPETWASTRLQIEAALAAARHRSARPALRLMVGLSAAAAALLVILLSRGLWTPGAGEEEPFPVATLEDVVILSMDPSDAPALVVGHPPTVEPIVLATHQEVTLVKAEPNADGGTPWLEQGAAPMIMPPSGPDDR